MTRTDYTATVLLLFTQRCLPRRHRQLSVPEVVPVRRVFAYALFFPGIGKLPRIGAEFVKPRLGLGDGAAVVDQGMDANC